MDYLNKISVCSVPCNHLETGCNGNMIASEISCICTFPDAYKHANVVTKTMAVMVTAMIDFIAPSYSSLNENNEGSVNIWSSGVV